MTSLLAVLAKQGDSWLDKIGLGSLDKIPWEAFPIALGLAALIGAAGGFVYAGLIGNRNEKRDKNP